MRTVTLQQPRRIVFGSGSACEAAEYVISRGWRRVVVVTSPPVVPVAEAFLGAVSQAGASVTVHEGVDREPTVGMFDAAIAQAREVQPDVVVGIGGGSALDVAKLVAAMHDSDQPVAEAFGSGKLAGRNTPLVCLPTTSGTGSEVSPNALLLDAADGRKKAVVSPYIVPDAAYVDPMLTVTCPPAVTAATGMDALIHCIEAYVNVNAHPAVDLYAMEGIHLIAANLATAVERGDDLPAREAMARGSLYGGLCLGPVNTAAVHALSYPLSEMFHLPHGLANSVLLADVMEFNAAAAPRRYAEIAAAMGAAKGRDEAADAAAAVQAVRDLAGRIGMAKPLRELGIGEDAIVPMAAAAMKVTRLLVNNPRAMTQGDIESIYRKAY